jgi:hypothetical protein
MHCNSFDNSSEIDRHDVGRKSLPKSCIFGELMQDNEHPWPFYFPWVNLRSMERRKNKWTAWLAFK